MTHGALCANFLSLCFVGLWVYLKDFPLKNGLHCCIGEKMMWQPIPKGLCRAKKQWIASNTLRDTHICVPKLVTNSPWNKTAGITVRRSKNIFQTIQKKRATVGTECICLLSTSNLRSFKNRCDTPCEAHFACHKACRGVFFKNRDCNMGTKRCIHISSFKHSMVAPYQLHQGIRGQKMHLSSFEDHFWNNTCLKSLGAKALATGLKIYINACGNTRKACIFTNNFKIGHHNRKSV